jgi:hypothetical protein
VKNDNGKFNKNYKINEKYDIMGY